MDQEVIRAINDIHRRIDNLLSCGIVQNLDADLGQSRNDILDLTEQSINLEFQVAMLEINSI